METVPSCGKCVVCGENATSTCGNCRKVMYCGKSHRLQNWPHHQSACRAWEICYDPDLGRHLLATRDLLPGDVILAELPLVWGPSIHARKQRICVGCGKLCNNVKWMCDSCRWPACSLDCQGFVNTSRHELECDILTHTRIIRRSEVLLVIRMLILWHMKSRRWLSLTALQSHEDSRGPGTEAHAEVTKISQHLEPILAKFPGSKNVLPKICGLIDVNAVETMPPEGSVAIYEHVSLLEHSCMPNTRLSFCLDSRGQPRITVNAATLIKRGEHLSTMYTHALWSTRVRREHLLATKYFTCRCNRCADPTEMGTHLGTLKCSCKNGLMLANNPLDPSTDWSCNVGPGTITSSEVAQLMDKLEAEIEEVMEHATVHTLSDLLSRLTVLLHPGHEHCIVVSHSLIQLLPPSDPQKPDLCKHIMNTINRVDPHETRLTLYKAITLRELASCPGEDKQAHLSKAAALLKMEPPESPGEKLADLIKAELIFE